MMAEVKTPRSRRQESNSENQGSDNSSITPTGAVDEGTYRYQQQQEIGMVVIGATNALAEGQFFVGSNTTKVLSKTGSILYC
ncbi:hypothetical protein O9993_18630 [Vibrio lentus]|nr:hypothetical protein [Vibrio lentus]